MMKLRIVFHFLAIAVLSFLCSCEGDEFVTFKYTNMKVANMRSGPGEPQSDNTDSIKKEIYCLRLNLYPVETSREGRYFDEYESGVSAEDPIADVDITTSDSFSVNYPTGADITNCFTYYPGNYFHCVPLGDGTTFRPTSKYRNDYADHNLPDFADLLLTTLPDNLVDRKIFVKVKYASGFYRLDSTKLFKLY